MNTSLLLLLLACGESEPTASPSVAVTEAEPGHPGDGHTEHGHMSKPHGDHATVSHRFDDPAKWAERFDAPDRDAWQKPADVLAAMSITPGMTVADIGAGTGYFNPHLAAAVGPSGKVIAADIEPNLVAHMTERAKTDGTPNVEARLGETNDPKLQPGEVDRILLVDTYHHINDRTDYFSRLKSTLKPSGKLIVVDFKSGDLPVGPPPAHRIPRDQVVSELASAGWTLSAEPDTLPHQFVLVFGVGTP